MTNALFESIAFDENPLYERIIEHIVAQKFSVVEDLFSAEDVQILRQSLIDKHEEAIFEKAAIGNRVNEIIVKSIRGDVILWIDEVHTNVVEKYSLTK